jgi:hypothetical protein
MSHTDDSTAVSECARNDISESVLLSYVGEEPRVQHLPGFQMVLLNLSISTHKTVSFWVRDLYGERWPQPDFPTSQAITKSITRVEAILLKLRKQHSSLEKEIDF